MRLSVFRPCLSTTFRLSALCVLLIAVTLLPAVAWANDKLLWRVNAPGGTTPVYLLGSVHVGVPDMYPLGEKIERAYAASDKVVLESLAEEEELAPFIMQYGLYMDGRTLDQTLSAETKAELAALNVDLTPFQRLKPWLFALTLAQTFYIELGYNPQYGVDAMLQERARQDGKTLGKLETLEQTLDLFRFMSLNMNDAEVRTTLYELQQYRDRGFDLVGAWRRGDADGIEAYLRDAFAEPEAKPFYKRFFLDRNETMADGIAELAAEGRPVLVVVGVGHLLGEGNVRELLTARGLKVDQP